MKIYPVVAGDLSGTMDRTVFYKVEDRCLGRKKAQYVERTLSEMEQKQRLMFGFMTKLGRSLKFALRTSLPKRPKYLSATNYFTRLNIKLCEVADLKSKEVTFDFENAVFAVGGMAIPTVEMTYEEAGRQISFSVISGVDREFPGNLGSDRVYVILLESMLLQAYAVELCTRGDGKIVSETLPQQWNKENVHVYAFATDESGKETSPSYHLTFA